VPAIPTDGYATGSISALLRARAIHVVAHIPIGPFVSRFSESRSRYANPSVRVKRDFKIPVDFETHPLLHLYPNKGAARRALVLSLSICGTSEDLNS